MGDPERNAMVSPNIRLTRKYWQRLISVTPKASSLQKPAADETAGAATEAAATAA